MGEVLSQLVVQILAWAVRRPTEQGSHTGEICVAISDSHIVAAAQLGYSQFAVEGAHV